MHVDVLADGCFQLLCAAEHTAANPLVRKLGEPALHQVDSGSVSGSKVHMESWALGRPLANEGRFVGAIVVHDEVHLQVRRHIRFDPIQKLAKF